jgi:hypothetical protein
MEIQKNSEFINGEVWRTRAQRTDVHTYRVCGAVNMPCEQQWLGDLCPSCEIMFAPAKSD